MTGFSGTVSFFANQGIPLPEVMVFLTAAAEFGGGICLLLGLLTRLATIPMMVAMLVAAFVVHGDNGWLTLSDGRSWLANERVMEAQTQESRSSTAGATPRRLSGTHQQRLDHHPQQRHATSDHVLCNAADAFLFRWGSLHKP